MPNATLRVPSRPRCPLRVSPGALYGWDDPTARMPSTRRNDSPRTSNREKLFDAGTGGSVMHALRHGGGCWFSVRPRIWQRHSAPIPSPPVHDYKCDLRRHTPSLPVLLLRQARSAMDTLADPPIDPPIILPCVCAAVLSLPFVISASTDAVCVIDCDTAHPRPPCWAVGRH